MAKTAKVTSIATATEFTTPKAEAVEMGKLLNIKEKTAINKRLGKEEDGSDKYTHPLMIRKFERVPELAQYYMEIDKDYQFPTVNEDTDANLISPIKVVMMGLEIGKTIFAYGKHGSGKNDSV